MCLPSPGCPALLLESPKRRTISPIIRNCTKRPLNVNQIAHPNSRMIRTYDHKMSLMTLIHPFNISILFLIFESFANIRISAYFRPSFSERFHRQRGRVAVLDSLTPTGSSPFRRRSGNGLFLNFSPPFEGGDARRAEGVQKESPSAVCGNHFAMPRSVSEEF